MARSSVWMSPRPGPRQGWWRSTPARISPSSVPCPVGPALKDADGAARFHSSSPGPGERRVRFVGEPVAAVVANSRQRPGGGGTDCARGERASCAWSSWPAPAIRTRSWCIRITAAISASTIAMATLTPLRRSLAERGIGCASIWSTTGWRRRRLEPSSCVADYRDGRFALYNPSQGAYGQQGILARAIFKVEPEQVRVISGDTGGGFGIRGEVYPEACVCLFAARDLGRPVKWRGTAARCFCPTPTAETTSRVASWAWTRGPGTGAEDRNVGQPGCVLLGRGPLVPTMAGGRIVGTVYRIPALDHSVRCLFTNVMPVAAYRGAGPPGGVLRDGAADGRRCRKSRPGSRRDPPSQLHPSGGHALHQPFRRDHAQRRVPADHGHGARACRLGGFCGTTEAASGDGRCGASASDTTWSHPEAGPRKKRG